jgi:8-oxo-dGTP diphosphatase
MEKKVEIPENYDAGKYWRPSLTTDVILFSGKEKDKSSVLLIRRKNKPYKGYWAFPGGFLEEKETLKKCAVRELEEETGITISEDKLHFLLIADSPDRDPRTRVISVVYFAIINIEEHSPEAADDASELAWFPLNNLPKLAFDHSRIISKAIRNLK